MNGYYYFERNNNNMCSIASYAIYPIVQVPSDSKTTVYPINQITNRPDLNNTTDNLASFMGAINFSAVCVMVCFVFFFLS